MIKNLTTRHASRVLPLVVLLCGAVAVGGGSPYLITIGTITVIWAVLALGLNVLMGYSGLINLGIGAFYALGAYGTAILDVEHDVSPLLVILGVPVVAFVLGLVLGPVVLRTRGLYFAVATLGIGIVVSDVLNNWLSFTKGPIGIAGIKRPGEISLGPVALDPNTPAGMFYLATAILIVVIIFAHWYHGSRLARVLIGGRDDELLAKSLGFSVTRERVLAFALSAAVAAIAGVLYAWFIRYISPPPFSFFLASFPAFVLVAVGGPGRVWGPVVGAIFLTGLPEILKVEATTMPIIYGGVLLLVMVLLPRGIVPSLASLVTSTWRRVRHPQPTTNPSSGSPTEPHQLIDSKGNEST